MYSIPIKFRLLALLFFAVALCVTLSASQELQPNEVKYERAALRISGSPTDSIIYIHYSLRDSAHVNIVVFDRFGEVFANPLFASKSPCDDSIGLAVGAFPDGHYSVELVLDLVRSHRMHARGFNHFSKTRQVTFSRVEDDLQNQAMQLQGADPRKSHHLFDSLITFYPSYLDRSAVFLNALNVYVKVSDSVQVRALIDSILARNPSSTSYRTIAGTFAWHKYGLRFARACAESAIARYQDVPPRYRNSYLFADYQVLANVYLASADDPNAEQALELALAIHESLPSWDRFVQYNVDVDLLKKLGPIKERKGENILAMQIYKKALTKEPDDPDIWALIQHAYIAIHKSNEQYSSYRQQLLEALPPRSSRLPETDTLVGTKFPTFALSTIDNQNVRLSDLRGRVLVINFWDYWCGYCLDERSILEKLYQQFKDAPFTILGVHGRAGVFGRPEDDLAAIRKSLKDYPTSFPTVVESETSRIAASLGVWGVPATCVVDKFGVIRFTEIGYDKYTTYSRLSMLVKSLLSE